MTNIAPQVSSFNQGIWENTEDIEACYRNLQRIYTWGGILYTDDSNDYFLDSHGIRTPDFWWKVVLTKDDSGADKIISWFFPNQENLGTLDSYLVSVADIEARLTDGLGAIPGGAMSLCTGYQLDTARARILVLLGYLPNQE
ncbi:hypothetical protein DYB37_012242, partial [Aphanomyces astaci]